MNLVPFFPIRGFPDNLFPYHFYGSSYLSNKGIPHKIYLGSLMQQHFVIETQLLDSIVGNSPELPLHQ